MTVSAVLTALAVLESTLPSFCLRLRGNHDGFDGCGGFGGYGHAGYPPLNSTPLFRHFDRRGGFKRGVVVVGKNT